MLGRESTRGDPLECPSKASPAVYTTALQPSTLRTLYTLYTLHTTYIGGVARMDVTLLRPTLSSCRHIPGAGLTAHTTRVVISDEGSSIVGDFDSEDLEADTNGYDGAPLRMRRQVMAAAS